MGFSRQEYRSGLPCSPPGGLPDPGTEPSCLTSLTFPALAGGFFTTSGPGTPQELFPVRRKFSSMPSPHPLLSQWAAGHVLPFCRYQNQSPSVVLVGCSRVFWNSLRPQDMLHPHPHTHLVRVTHQAGHGDRVRQCLCLGPARLTALTARQRAFSFSLLKSAEQAERDFLIHSPLL